MVPDVPAEDVIKAAERHPAVRLVIGGASAATLRDSAASVRDLPGLYADTSQVDGVDSLKMLLDAGIGGKLLFGSHAPVFMPAASIARLLHDQSDDAAMTIVVDNAAKLMSV